MLDEIATVDEVHRLAFVDTGRPARNIAGDAFAAIENVEFFDARFAGLRMGRTAQHYRSQKCRCETNRSIHVVPPLPRFFGISLRCKRILPYRSARSISRSI